ncbi:MAG TPA: tRNA (adenosine(37)-N6)-dimethylallyltransferase MiaA [Microthrixaceae bacterium]|nr:tRNA (adenosine(37)-N6)-dimethylallyltransferase MiaA [Microthrixaceae bacterium]
MSPPPLALVGPTASGKSDVAMALAAVLPGAEVLSIDSMQVYRGMDIGTAKPSADERARVPHHLIDLLDPDEECSVWWFRHQAELALDDVRGREAVPLLVGGTGLYHRALIDDLDIPGQWPDVRAEVDADPDTAALHRRLAELDPIAASRMEPSNRRRVVRALEVTLGSGRPFSSYGAGLDTYPPTEIVQVGLRTERSTLASRLDRRIDLMLDRGLVDEVRALDARREGWSRTAAQALGYRQLLPHVRGEATLEACIEQMRADTRRFATRQERWFRRDPRVRWVDVDGLEAGAVADAVLDIWSS